jgi:hypothetical protein
MTSNEDRPVKVELNCETGEEIITPLSDEEIAEIEESRKQAAAMEAAHQAEIAAKAEAKASALAKLAALGLTEEEAAALAG